MTEKEPYDPSQYELIQVDAETWGIMGEHGYCFLSKNPVDDKVNVDWVELYDQGMYSRRGIGQNILRHSADVARRIGAAGITASIINRESLASFSRVFGDEHIRVEMLGRFVDPDPGEPDPGQRHTRAILDYPISPPSTRSRDK